MVMYEFRCPVCQKDFTVPLDPHNDDLVSHRCDKGHIAKRLFSFQMGHIADANGDMHGDGFNLGLGRHFKSIRERDYYADSHGYVHQEKHSDPMGDELYNKRKKAKERVEARNG